MNKKGFTLIEILVVVAITGILFSVAMPASYSMYRRYQASMKAENMLLFISSVRMDAFLYNEEKLIESRNGKLIINDSEPEGYGDFFVMVDKPVRFYSKGTSSGGTIRFYTDNHGFVIDVKAPLGNMDLRQLPG